MTSDDDDDVLVAELRRIAGEVDAVPGDVAAASRLAITTRDLDHELALLVADSAATEPERSFEAVRAHSGVAESRLLSFKRDPVQVDLDVTQSGDDRVSLIGQFSGVAVVECTVEQANGASRRLEVDELGRFIVDEMPAGPVRLRCRSASGVRIRTAWVTL